MNHSSFYNRLYQLVLILFLPLGIPYGFASPPESSAASDNPLSILKNTFNIHLSEGSCFACHDQVASPENPDHQLRDTDLENTCRCHYGNNQHLPHPTEINPPQDMLDRIGTRFPLQDGNITCVTCHSMKVLCQSYQPGINILRGGPYPNRTDFCFACHEESNYLKYNPHNQLTEANQIDEDKCLYCHVEKPAEDTVVLESGNLIGEPEMLCRGCHSVSEFHCGGARHLVKPSDKAFSRIKKIEKKFGVILPLDGKGKLTCVTCHNPHSKGVIAAHKGASKGAGAKLFLRLPGQLCEECHQMGKKTKSGL